MKKIIAFIFFAVILISCNKIDNYEEPNATVEGFIYDKATIGSSDPISIPTQSPNGARVKLYESNYSQPIIFWCNTDGSFHNERVFPGNYRIIVEGPFIVNTEDTINVSIPSKDKIKFHVEPFLRIKATANKNGSNIDMKFVITKSNQWSEHLTKYVILYSWTQCIDYNSYSFREIIDVDVNEEMNILDKEKMFTIKNVNSDRPVFVRIAALTTGTNYYNYSEVIEVK